MTNVESASSVDRGRPHPLGAHPTEEGVNFSLFADRATSVTLLLFATQEDEQPFQMIPLRPMHHRTFGIWHVYVRGLKPGSHYAYRIGGPSDLQGAGDRFNPMKVLLDPYARGNTNRLWDRVAACSPNDNVTTSMRSVIIDTKGYDWEGDRPLNRPMNETIIYEMHVRGFTRSASAQVRNPGTFAGIVEKIPYLQQLGVTAVELLPVFDFDEKGVVSHNPDGSPLSNYWGYDPYGFFAPHSSYCASPETGEHVIEFRDMVKALHKAGIEVILDVVFNHTSEGTEQGPTINLRGIANAVYYLLSPEDRQYYLNYSGCGNTVAGSHPVVAKLILECLEWWVNEMHVDGFRFDEMTILSRAEDGRPLKHPPTIWQIELSEVLANTKIIAEPWDAGQLYQLGDFPGRWSVWNDRYRDTVRRFIRGDGGYIDGKTLVGRFADVISGSAEIFESRGGLPTNSINFVTAHDGFTLNDLVSYADKHNEANGHGNLDGNSNNISANYGVEGASSDLRIESLRERQIKNFAAILFLSRGVPMFVMGDEVRRTQCGNNNAYCQDNEITWFDWTLIERQGGLRRFFQEMIAFRKRHQILHPPHFFTGEANERGIADIAWHGCALFGPGWDNPNCRVLAFTMGGLGNDPDLHVMVNMESQALDFELPTIAGRVWRGAIDTARASPEDIAQPGHEVIVAAGPYRVTEHSVVVLIAE